MSDVVFCQITLTIVLYTIIQFIITDKYKNFNHAKWLEQDAEIKSTQRQNVLLLSLLAFNSLYKARAKDRKEPGQDLIMTAI